MEAADARGRAVPVAARRRRPWAGAAPLGRLLRRPGQPRRAPDRARAAELADRRQGRARARGRRRVRVVRGGAQEAQGHHRAAARLPLPPRLSAAGPSVPSEGVPRRSRVHPAARAAAGRARREEAAPARAHGRRAAHHRRPDRAAGARARRGARPAGPGTAGLARARRPARAPVVPLVRADVQADLLLAHVVADELRARDVGARCRLARSRERRGRAGAGRLGAAQGRHAGRGHRPADRGLLHGQERGELRRGRGDRDGDVGRRRARRLAAAHDPARVARAGGDRGGPGDRRAGAAAVVEATRGPRPAPLAGVRGRRAGRRRARGRAACCAAATGA